MTVEAARQPGRSPRRPGAAVPQFRHQSWSGSIGAPQARQVRAASGGLAGCSGGLSGGACGAASGARTGSASSSFTCPGLHTPRADAQSAAAVADAARAQARAISRRSVAPLTGVPLTASTTRSASLSGTLRKREALEHAHVAHRLAVDARPRCVTAWTSRRPRRPRRGRRRRSAWPAARRRRARSCGLECRRGRSARPGAGVVVRALGPRRDLGADVALDRLELALLARLDERDRAARAADAAGAPDAVHVDVGRGRARRS